MSICKFLAAVTFLLYGISAGGNRNRGSDSRPSRHNGGSDQSYGYRQSGGSSSGGSYGRFGSKGGKKGGKGKGGKDGKGGKGGHSSDINYNDPQISQIRFDLEEFYDLQSSAALCNYQGYDRHCIDKDDYFSFFDSNCNICVLSQDYKRRSRSVCYNTLQYQISFDNIYGEFKAIYQWDYKFTDIQVFTNSAGKTWSNGYGEQETEKEYAVKVILNKKYIEGRCEYRTCETEELRIVNGKITSYKSINVKINSKMCEGGSWDKTKPPTSWGKSTPSPSTSLPPTTPDTTEVITTRPPPVFETFPPTPSPATTLPTSSIVPRFPTSAPTQPEYGYTTQPPSWHKPSTTETGTTSGTLTPDIKPPSASPSWSPTTPSPTTAQPTEEPTKTPTTPQPTPKPTEHPTTAKPTPGPTPVPTTAKPTESPTTPKPTPQPTEHPTTGQPTPCPITPEPTPIPTPNPTTLQPTPAPSTPEPTTSKPTTAEPTPVPTRNPTTQRPTTAEPTTDKPTTAEPTNEPTPKPVEPIPPAPTRSPTIWEKIKTKTPTKRPTSDTCNYNCNEMKCDDNQCEYGYKCVKEGYDDCDASYDPYCPGICVKEGTIGY